MDTDVSINFNVTPLQKEAIVSRMLENGFDELSAYLKVVSLKAQKFNATSADRSTYNASIELGFKITELQQTTLEKNLKESSCEDLSTYLKHVALYGVIMAVVEVRSTGNLDAMLERIAKSKGKD
ncbi:MAG: hypothetical protein ACI9TV_002312 [Sulfurimonas sp.]|jgi:hypothetical protein|uniref:hypothetical protein n=1 Tax=Sulfurimonas sp. TaxID=2022749 RepID=UPI0039E64254